MLLLTRIDLKRCESHPIFTYLYLIHVLLFLVDLCALQFLRLWKWTKICLPIKVTNDMTERKFEFKKHTITKQAIDMNRQHNNYSLQ